MPAFIVLAVLAAFRILGRNKLRTGLTMLGIVIGIGAVVTMVSIGQGAQMSIQTSLAMEGTNLIWIWPGSTGMGGIRGGQGTKLTLTVEDAVELKRRIPLLRDTCYGRRDPSQVVYRQLNWRVAVIGTTPSCLSLRNWSFSSGGPITQADMDSAATVAVLGQTVVDYLFEPGADPVGAVIRIKNVPFRVVGVLARKGHAVAGHDQDDIIFIPFSTAQRKVHRAAFYNAVEGITAAAEQRDDIPEVVEQIRQVLRERHRLHPDQPDDFTIRTQLDVAAVYEGSGRTLTWLIFAVASFSLLVGGIGIMNMLLVSVTERTREIGVRMAVGAKRRHILVQFLIEAMTLGLVGGVVGILFGIAGARLATVVAGWPTIISAESVVVAFLFSLAVGLFFGLYPANKAARLNPIEALRYE
ncbi:MAG: multidrug ABC transporter substrate-binding protein [Nitrospiraceae bacterium]|nr:MAG: multidrug ABC transporter substrate-binding protein [Nitrospiraceae bacterium]